MRTKRFHGLKRPKVRMTMNKFNLYNISRQRGQFQWVRGTYFQQKWKAKAAARGYHGEVIKEGQWENMFQHRIRAVVPMNVKYLARFDGAEQATGRGSGAHEPVVMAQALQKVKQKQIPYMAMTFAPAERRLDTAIFRALFASSARQARQFVIHGFVKVNGKKMTYPGYLLNPGDLFQVDPERVMFALGASKDASEREASRNLKKRIAKAVPAEGEEATEGTPEPAEPVDPETAEKKARKAHKDSLQALLQDAKDILEDTSSAKKKQRIRAFAATVRRAIGSSRGKELESLDDEVNDLMNKLSIAEKTQKFDDSAVPTDALRSGDPSLTKAKEESAETEEPREHSAEEKRLIRKALQEIRENPIDPSKPYATPWRPRPFLPAFAFVPRYLEVNHNICSAVYLRHPVARPGLAEVPTPFPLNAMGLSYNWYLRRGR